MKKFIALLLAAIMCVSMVACSNSGEEKESEEESREVEVTIPAFFFMDKDEEEIEYDAEQNGYGDYDVNRDGSVTFTMTKDVRKEKRDYYKELIEAMIDAYLNGDDKVESYMDIQYNKNFSELTIYVDGDTYTVWDNLYCISFYYNCAHYQAFSGVDSDEIEVKIEIVDNDTEEVLESLSFREFAKNSMEAGEEEAESQPESMPGFSSESDDEEEAEPEAVTIVMQETVVMPDVCEFYVDYMNMTRDVIPPMPDNWYSHYEAENGKVYVDVCIAYKNLATTDRGADDIMKATLVYSGKYQYTGFSMIEEDSRKDFTYSNITNIAPLSTEYVHYLFEVPEEIETSTGALNIWMNIEGKDYSIVFREGTEGDAGVPGGVEKERGAVAEKETIAIDGNCEFYVDYTNITNDVMPPQPGDWYSHYVADQGKVYVDFCIAYKNWKAQRVGADDVISAKLLYAGKYEYKGFSMIEEDNRGDFTYSNITYIEPLATEYIHYLFEVPEEVANSSEPVQVNFVIGGNDYIYHVR